MTASVQADECDDFFDHIYNVLVQAAEAKTKYCEATSRVQDMQSSMDQTSQDLNEARRSAAEAALRLFELISLGASPAKISAAQAVAEARRAVVSALRQQLITQGDLLDQAIAERDQFKQQFDNHLAHAKDLMEQMILHCDVSVAILQSWIVDLHNLNAPCP